MDNDTLTATEQGCKTTTSQESTLRACEAISQPCAHKRIVRIRNPNGPRSELIVTPRSTGGVTIAQGPAYVLVGPSELGPVIDAMRQLANTV